MRTRIGWASAVAVLGLALTLAFAGAQGAAAVQGQALIAGQLNTETGATVLTNSNEAIPGCTAGSYDGFAACGTNGVSGIGTQWGVVGDGGVFGLLGSGDDTGVYGGGAFHGVEGVGGPVGVWGRGTSNGVEGTVLEGASGNGVYGHVQTSNTSGVYGQNFGAGYGVVGRANAGIGVLGDSSGGIGMRASTQGGTALEATASDGGTGIRTAAAKGGLALKVMGKARFSRSGRAVVQAGQSSITISNVGVGAKSLVLATAQKSVGGIYVQAAVPDTTAKTITIYLNTTVNQTYPVAWFVVERP